MVTKKIPSESMEQIRTVSWFRKTFPDVKIWATPNGGKRGMATAMKLKAEGVLKGVPDLYVPKWHLWIEMKRQKGGRLSPEQVEVIEYLERECGDTCLVCKGFEDAKEQILNYS